MDLGRVSILESQNVFKDTILFNINKVKVSLQAKGGGTVSFLITVPDGIQGQCHAMPASPMGYNRSTCCSGGWVGPTAGLDGWEKRKSLAPSGVQSLNCPVCNVFTPTMLSWPLIYHSCCWSILWHKQIKSKHSTKYICGNTHMSSHLFPLFSPPFHLTALLPLSAHQSINRPRPQKLNHHSKALSRSLLLDSRRPE